MYVDRPWTKEDYKVPEELINDNINYISEEDSLYIGLVLINMTVTVLLSLSVCYMLYCWVSSNRVGYFYNIIAVEISILLVFWLYKLVIYTKFLAFKLSFKVPDVTGFSEEESNIIRFCATHIKILGEVKRIEKYNINLGRNIYNKKGSDLEAILMVAIRYYRVKCKDNLENLDTTLKGLIENRGFDIKDKHWEYTFSNSYIERVGHD